jgi:uncharacterized protein (TIGR03546 family)
MLTVIQLIRKLFKQLKSDLTPTQLAVGAFLGALAGLTPFGLHLVALFLVALLFNCSMAAFLFVFGATKPVGLALGAVSFRLGESLLSDGSGLWASFIRALSDAPVLAWLGYDRYVVAGGYAIALPAALALGIAVRLGVAAYRRKLTPKLADAAWYENAMKSRLFRFFHWVIAGKDKEFVEPKKRFLLLRPFRAYMAVFVPALCIALSVGGGLYAQVIVKDVVAKGASKALGVQCTFGTVEYSFFGQRFAFTDFQLPDPSNTKENMVQVGGFEADLGFLSLLSGRFHIEKLALRDVSAHVVRTEDGKLNVTELPGAKPEDPAEQSSWNEWTAWLAEKGKETDWTGLWKRYQEYRKKAAEKRKEEAAKPDKPKPPPLAYDPSLRWTPERRDPLFRIDLIGVKNFALRLTDRSSPAGGLPAITSVSARGDRLSTMPGWDGRPMELAGSGLLDDGKSGKLEFSLRYLPAKADGDFSIQQVPLTALRSAYEKTLPVNVEQGRVTVATKQGVAGGSIDGRVDLTIEGLKIAAKPGVPRILGLDPEMSRYAIEGINAYGEKLPIAVGAAVTGPLEDPSIEAKVPFLEIAKKGLEMLGRKELDKVIGRLGGEIDTLKKAGVEKIGGNVKGVAEGAVKAVTTGDTKAAEDALKKAKEDVKSLSDSKKELEQKKDAVKDALDLFKKKK